MKICFTPLTEERIALIIEWSKRSHVANSWFREGYAPVESIYQTIREGYYKDHYNEPYILELDGIPSGYLQFCNLDRYKEIESRPAGVLLDEPSGTYCLDIFLAHEEQLGRGIGTAVVREFCRRAFLRPEVKRIVLDPAVTDRRAVRCYEKVGFRPLRTVYDGVCEVVVMELYPGDELRLIVMRHGEADHNICGVFNSDPTHPSYFLSHLTEGGREQTRQAARELLRAGFSQKNVVRLIASPAPRTQETAAILVEESVASGFEVDDRLREIGAGPHEGESMRGIERWMGEPFASVDRRVEGLLQESDMRSGHVMWVTHGTPCTRLIRLQTGKEEKLQPGGFRILPLKRELS